MGASYPKPDDQRINRVPPKFDWVDLPTKSRRRKPPKLPEWRIWNPGTVVWWKDLWAKPQAVMWEPNGSTLFALACLYDDLISNRAEAAKVSAEMRQHEDRHGLNPKAMLQLRWRLEQPEDEQATRPARRRTSDRRKGALQVIEGG